MKIKFTQEEMDAIETAFYDHEGIVPYNIFYTPEQKEYKILQQLWQKMAKKIGEKLWEE